MSDAFTITLTDAPGTEDVAELHQALQAFNVPRSQIYDARDLALFARREDGVLVGGLTGLTNWGWLYVDYLWVADETRGTGLGSRLMAMAEAEALARGCARSRLYTYDFQAPEFYKRLGYTVWGVLEDYPPGHQQIWYRKDLTAD